MAEITPIATNKYSEDFVVPEEFPEILRDLTREILRSQPKDINKFGKTLHFLRRCGYFDND